jgi:predicted RND superfamily exporter protein
VRGLGSFIVRHRVLVAAALVAATALLGWRASLLEEDLSFETLYLSGDPNIDFSEEFAREFENVNDMIAIAITGPDLFDRDFLKAMEDVTDEIEKIHFVDSVRSLANTRYVQGKGDELDVEKFLEDMPGSAEEAEECRKKALAYELFQGRLLSRDGKYAAIIVQTADIVGVPAIPDLAASLDRLGSGDAAGREKALRDIVEIYERTERRRGYIAPEAVRLIEGLAGADGADRDRAAEKLASLGSLAVKRMSVEDRRQLIRRVEDIVAAGLPEGYRQHVTGTNVIERDYAGIIRWDRTVFHTLTILVLMVAFYLSFFSLRDTLIACSALLLAGTCALGAVQLAGGVIDIINSALLTMILVVGTSDAIHMIHCFYREWEEGPEGEGACGAAARMVGSVGFACLMTSATTACGFASLYFARISSISQFGLNMAIAVVVTYAVSLVSLTLFLSFIRKPAAWRGRPGSSGRFDRLLRTLARLVVDRRATVAVCCVLVMAFLGFGLARLRVESHAVGELSESSPTKVNIKVMENLAGFIGFEVSLKTGGDTSVLEPEVLRKVDRMASFLRERKETIETWSVVDYLKVMNRAAQGGENEHYAVPGSVEAAEQFLLLYSFSPEGQNEINGLVSRDRRWLRLVSRVYDVSAGPYLTLRDDIEALGRELFEGSDFDIRVTSESFLLHEAMDRIVSDLARSISFAFVFVAVFIGFTLRSLRFGLVTIVPNLIPTAATLGFMGLTGIPLRVGTVVVFSLGLGIAVDDTIHYLLRYRRERSRAASFNDAVFRTHFEIGKPLILTSLVLMAGFLVTVPATFKSLQHMGILNSFTIGVALLADLFVTPLLLRLTERSGAGDAGAAETPGEAG